MRTNILLITVDDMNYSSVGVYGCNVQDITPSIDRLASEGIMFKHTHVAAAICQPSRQAIMTGRYPHNNGAPGFNPIRRDLPTLPEELKKAGYLNGIIGKVSHLAPIEKFCWDIVIETLKQEYGFGREPAVYYQKAKEFFNMAKKENRPFFLMANSHDPHRPFAGSANELKVFGQHVNVDRWITAEEAEIPGFLPDLPDVRKEVAEYLTSVHRADTTVGVILKALDESGFKENTLVIFLSDNGMSFPFAKTNCYLNSSKTPLIIRWPGKVEPGTIDENHMVCGTDFMATILEAVDLPEVEGMDGQSFLHCLTGNGVPEREYLMTEINTIASLRYYPMRCLHHRDFGYIFNPWSNGITFFQNEPKAGYTYKAMKEAADNGDAYLADRVKLFDYRVKEELYDFRNDPDGLVNLASDSRYTDVLNKMRAGMHEQMKASNDPVIHQLEELMGIEPRPGGTGPMDEGLTEMNGLDGCIFRAWFQRDEESKVGYRKIFFQMYEDISGENGQGKWKPIEWVPVTDGLYTDLGISLSENGEPVLSWNNPEKETGLQHEKFVRNKEAGFIKVRRSKGNKNEAS